MLLIKFVITIKQMGKYSLPQSVFVEEELLTLYDSEALSEKNLLVFNRNDIYLAFGYHMKTRDVIQSKNI